MTTLPEIIGAFVADAFELTGWHGGSVAGLAIGLAGSVRSGLTAALPAPHSFGPRHPQQLSRLDL